MELNINCIPSRCINELAKRPALFFSNFQAKLFHFVVESFLSNVQNAQGAAGGGHAVMRSATSSPLY